MNIYAKSSTEIQAEQPLVEMICSLSKVCFFCKFDVLLAHTGVRFVGRCTGFGTAERYVYTTLDHHNPIGGLGVTFLRKQELDRISAAFQIKLINPLSDVSALCQCWCWR